MKLNKVIVFLIIFIFVGIGNSFSQDEIRLLDGNSFYGKVVSVNDTIIVYEIETTKKIKSQAIDPQSVYSIAYADGREEFIYKYDASKEGELTVEDMGFFRKGLMEANKSYKTPGTIIGGVTLGAASVIFFPLAYLYPAVGTPLIYTTGHLLPFSKVKDKNVKFDSALAQNDKYVLGYKEGARKKRIANALKSSIGGAVLGIVTYVIVSPKFK